MIYPYNLLRGGGFSERALLSFSVFQLVVLSVAFKTKNTPTDVPVETRITSILSNRKELKSMPLPGSLWNGKKHCNSWRSWLRNSAFLLLSSDLGCVFDDI